MHKITSPQRAADASQDAAGWLVLHQSICETQDRQRQELLGSALGRLIRGTEVLTFSLVAALLLSLVADSLIPTERSAFWILATAPIVAAAILFSIALAALPEAMLAASLADLGKDHEAAASVVRANATGATPFLLYLRGFRTERVLRVPWWRRAIAAVALLLRVPARHVTEPADLAGLAIGELSRRSAGYPRCPAVLMLRNLSHPHIWTEGVPALCATDEAWQDAVRLLAVRARALILLVDETASQGLRWEIDLIVSLGLQAKTIALIPDTMSPDVVETLSQLGLPRPHHVRCLRGSDRRWLSASIAMQVEAIARTEKTPVPLTEAVQPGPSHNA